MSARRKLLKTLYYTVENHLPLYLWHNIIYVPLVWNIFSAIFETTRSASTCNPLWWKPAKDIHKFHVMRQYTTKHQKTRKVIINTYRDTLSWKMNWIIQLLTIKKKFLCYNFISSSGNEIVIPQEAKANCGKIIMQKIRASFRLWILIK